VGGEDRIQHLLGKAVDISGSAFTNRDRLRLIELASKNGAIGIGIYSGGGLHFDNRASGMRAGWGDSFKNPSVPQYAKNTINRHIAGVFFESTALAPEPTNSVDLSGFSTADRAKIMELEADPAWKNKLDKMQAKHGFSRTQFYQIIKKESAFNPISKNEKGSASGFFQFVEKTARGLGYTSNQIRYMSPSEQLQVYDEYLTSYNYRSTNHLGVMQGAPSYAGRSPNTIVYRVGSDEWKSNKVWRPADGGDITLQSMTDYYENYDYSKP
jgi:hypothetical protein